MESMHLDAGLGKDPGDRLDVTRFHQPGSETSSVRLNPSSRTAGANSRTERSPNIRRVEASKTNDFMGSAGRLARASIRGHGIQSCNGLRVTKPGKRLKSRSTVQNSVTPDAIQIAAILASCTIRSSHFSVFELFLEETPVRVGFGEQFRNRGFQPRFDLVHGLGDRRRRIVESRVAHNGQELVNTRPRQPPTHPALGK